MLTFPDLSFLKPANLQFKIQFSISQLLLKPSSTGSSFPTVFVWHFVQAESHLKQIAISSGLCMQTGKILGLSKRKKECSQNCLFSFAFTQTHEKYKYENSRRHGGKKANLGTELQLWFDRRNRSNCQVLSKSFYCSQEDFSFPTHVLPDVKCIVVFQDPGYGKRQL